jgi:hypothetical protein
MTDPIATTAAVSAPVSVGLMALLIGAFGPVAADVMLVVLSALAGCFVALSSVKSKSIFQALGFIALGVLVSLILSWAIVGVVVSFVPSLSGPYAPSIIAMAIGFCSNRLPRIFDAVLQKIENKTGVTEK